MNDTPTSTSQLREKLIAERAAGLSQFYMAQKLLEEADEKVKSASQRIQMIDAVAKEQTDGSN